jgi:hypothetical protein
MQVNSARVDCLVRTLVSVLSASVSCRVVRPDGDAGEEMLCVGSSVSPVDCRELLQSCATLVEELGDCDGEIFFLQGSLRTHCNRLMSQEVPINAVVR